MIKEKDIYLKAYVEIYEIIRHLPEEEQNKIPIVLKNNLIKKMDKSYFFQFDENKELDEQLLLPETKSLIIVIYQKYLMKSDEAELWDKYNRICYKMIEEEKNKNYNVDIFSKFNHDKFEVKEQLIVSEKISFIDKLKCIILNIFKKFKNN